MSEYFCSFSFHLASLSSAAVDLSFKDDFGSAFGAHYGYLGRWPGKVHIGANVFGVHHIISAAIGLAGNDGNTRHGASQKA